MRLGPATATAQTFNELCGQTESWHDQQRAFDTNAGTSYKLRLEQLRNLKTSNRPAASHAPTDLKTSRRPSTPICVCAEIIAAPDLDEIVNIPASFNTDNTSRSAREAPPPVAVARSSHFSPVVADTGIFHGPASRVFYSNYRIPKRAVVLPVTKQRDCRHDSMI